jgi:deazaflavin-dependent oxidoreductase (nitroreductase family)
VPGYIAWLNVLLKPLIRIGVPMGPDVMLTVSGRTSGRPRSTPVAVAEIGGRRWLVAPFGETDWVRNLRAAGRATLSSGRRGEAVIARELSATERVVFFRDVLNPYVRTNVIARWFVRSLDGIPEDPVRAAEATLVFEVKSQDGP